MAERVCDAGGTRNTYPAVLGLPGGLLCCIAEERKEWLERFVEEQWTVRELKIRLEEAGLRKVRAANVVGEPSNARLSTQTRKTGGEP